MSFAPTSDQQNSHALRLCEASHNGKNYLFAGADSGGKRAVSVYTLIGTALLNGVNPEAWLRHVLERIVDLPISRVCGLLPWNVRDKLAADNSSA